MSFYNCGAYVDGQRPKSKKALREAMTADSATVYFDGTAVALAGGPVGYAGNGIPAGITLAVAGPDPYTSRKWYANVKISGGQAEVQ